MQAKIKAAVWKRVSTDAQDAANQDSAPVSVQESWLIGAPDVQDVLVAFAGWMARQESDRRSERTKAALAKRKAQGLPVGRVRGAGDRKPRRRSGYVAAWEAGGECRLAEPHPRPVLGAALGPILGLIGLAVTAMLPRTRERKLAQGR